MFKLKPIKQDKRGVFTDIIVYTVIVFITVLLLGLTVWAFGLITNTMTAIPDSVTPQQNISISSVAKSTLGQINAQMFWIRIIAFVIIAMEAISIFVTSFYSREHPVLFVPYILIIIIAVVIAVILSNTYEGLLTDNNFGATLQSFTWSTYVLLNFPSWVAIVGIVGMIIALIGVIVDKNAGGGI